MCSVRRESKQRRMWKLKKSLTAALTSSDAGSSTPG